jgi:hypothetical protein
MLYIGSSKVIVFIMGAFVALMNQSVAAIAVDFDPIALYGAEIHFDILRKGSPAGSHIVTFERMGDGVLVRSNFELKVDLLFVTVYRFLYRSEAFWRGGSLQHLTANVDDNGATFSIGATRDGNSVSIEHDQKTYEVSEPLFPTSHWNSHVLGQKRVLNTLTGRINRVTIEPGIREQVTTEWGDVTATRYAYTGDLNTEVWYDDLGRWVKMRFGARDGSTIEYVCRRCQGGSVEEAKQ